MRSFAGDGSIAVKSGLVKCGKETTACPGASPGSRDHRLSSMPAIDFFKLLTTPESESRCRINELTNDNTWRGKCCGSWVTKVNPSQRLRPRLASRAIC